MEVNIYINDKDKDDELDLDELEDKDELDRPMHVNLNNLPQ